MTPAEKAMMLFDTGTENWTRVDPHVTANIRFGLRLYMQGKWDEETLAKSVSHYYKPGDLVMIMRQLMNIAEQARA